MIEAEIHGKLGRNYTRAHDRAEDLLTSTAFGLLQYLPPPWGICKLLGSVQRVELNSGEVSIRRGDRWLDFPADTTCSPSFWPSAGKYGQPDLLLTLARGDGSPLAKVLIEVKFLSGKSPWAESAVDIESEIDSETKLGQPRDPDQLVRYWQWLSLSTNGLAHAIVYLTTHVVPPVTELMETLVREPTMRLGWLSWRDVWLLARECAQKTGSLPATDLARILAHKGFDGFEGFHRPSGAPLTNLKSGFFWRRRRWFQAADLRPEELSSQFWKG